ncbi:hypothetical protein EA462_11850 [Natrarchaeobius halalkaliphilus]|uniref:Uncharacterized protein n=1 Tax=Natrarchaeobius halalkaliphilus TaxID=1679091 RepID=A0A3N6P1T0_9EURY|nr:hypothetical protein [Natrarchaeobius halalkaliphilus]RQG89065.1 hypothetical protein EA462_11850 [Natrarchaeobius halalkaliphilus]
MEFNVIIAFLIGFIWGTIVFIYGKVSNADPIPRYDGTFRSAIRIGIDIAFVGGGTGTVVYLTESYLSAFQYGLAGIVFACIAVAVSVNFR